ncbi:MAG TPA: hypothetical protein VGB56_05775 [Flavisolibacter sp.]
MKTYTFPFIIPACILVLVFAIGCQKEFTPQLPGVPTVSANDPKALAASIKVWHGTRMQGTAPAPAGSDLELDPLSMPTVKAFAGRYATIQPGVISGNVVGYYVSIAGSGQYFKVDYSKPRNISGRMTVADGKRENPFSPNRVDSAGGNVDSALVIVLPPNINVPDTFCVTYCAYDALGNISQPVTTCITVNSLGGDANSDWLNGSWKITAQWEENGYYDSIIYNKWLPITNYKYYCDYDSSNNIYKIVNYDNGTIPIADDSTFYRKLDYSFSANGAFSHSGDGDTKHRDWDDNNCQSPKFHPVETENETRFGGWNFDAATNRLTLIFELDQAGTSLIQAWEFDVVKINNGHFIVVDNSDPTERFSMRLEK